MSPVAITRAPGRELARCELTHLARQPIDFSIALAQHRRYQSALSDAGYQVVELPSDPILPDGVFVEDTAIVLDELAVLTAPKPPTRRPEVDSIGIALAPYRSFKRIPSDAFLEGGDVLRVGWTLFVGRSERTGNAGIQALESIVRPFGYAVVPVRVTGCLHLKSACCALDDGMILLNRDWIDIAPFSAFQFVDVAEPFGANVLRLPDSILVSAAYPATAERIRRAGYRTVVLDVSELHKAESGLTCMSLLMPV